MIAWMIRSILVAALVALAALAVERALPAGARSRWIWACALLAAACLPWLGAILPGALDVLPWPSLGDAVPGAGPAAGSPSATASGDAPGAWVLTGWVLASGALVTLLAVSSARLRRVMRAAPWARLAGGPVRLTPDLGPAVVGVVDPQIAVPRWLLALSPGEMRLALDHEREHLRAGDTRLLAGAVAVCAAVPWNLPLWWMARRLGRAVEADCDARVLASHDPADYGRLLLRVAGHGGASRPAVLALVGARGNLERRIRTMSSPPKRFHSLLGVPLLAAAAAALFVACDAADELTAPEARADAEASFSFAEVRTIGVKREIAVRRSFGEKGEATFHVEPGFRLQLRPELSVSATGADGSVREIGGNHFQAQAPFAQGRLERVNAVEARLRAVAPRGEDAPHEATFELREMAPRQ